MYLYDTYIWARPNPTKTLMLGSYPFPGNLYAQNTVEYITVYVKDGIPKKHSIEEKNRADCPKRSGWITPNMSGISQYRTKETSLMGSILP